MKRYKVTLTKDERTMLEALKTKGSHKSQKVLNALILLNTDEGPYGRKSTNEQICSILGVSMRKIDRVKERFVEEGIDIALEGRPKERSYEHLVDGDLEAHIIALSCSQAPDGFSRWSLRMLADKAVELQYADHISYETVRKVLKKTNLSRGK